MNRQVEIKAEQIARMIVKGIPKTKIAIEMGMTYDGLVRITRCPEYIAIEDRVKSGVIGKMDARLARRATLESELEDAVPEAMQVLLESVRKRRDLKAALEVLDRDPTHQFNKRPATETFTQQPNISSEALALALKEADVTHKIMQAASQISDDQKPASA